MGRIVSPSEHRMSGIVTIGRPHNPNVVLPTELQEKQEQALARIADIKERTRVGADAGRLAVAEQNSIPATEAQVIGPIE